MLLRLAEGGLYCEAGDFYIDPWQPVDRAVITHAHGDHERPGSAAYLAAKCGVPVLQTRLGPEARVEHAGEVWVVSGDYKLDPDPTCDPFEPVRCDTFITESTFGLPIYRWRT